MTHKMRDDRERLLQILRQYAHALGHTPVKSEFPQWRELKRHFGSWEDAVKAAGLEPANSPGQQYLRARQRSRACSSVISI